MESFTLLCSHRWPCGQDLINILLHFPYYRPEVHLDNFDIYSFRCIERYDCVCLSFLFCFVKHAYDCGRPKDCSLQRAAESLKLKVTVRTCCSRAALCGTAPTKAFKQQSHCWGETRAELPNCESEG